MQCKEWDDANSELFKESHDEAVHKISYESRLYELISASLAHRLTKESQSAKRKTHQIQHTQETRNQILFIYQSINSFNYIAFNIIYK